MRKLASIQKIKDIRSIEGADKIEVATVNGWDVVIKKGEYNIGDDVIYCEVDSFLPIRDEFEFLRKSSYKKLSTGEEGFRLKTIRLRGQVSQGLILPLSILQNHETGRFIGQDVSEELGIIKYEPPVPAQLSGKVLGYFPSYISKTDEERIQNFSDEEYEHFKNDEWFVTEKLDGSSSTFYFKDGKFGVCSRNLELKETEDNTFWKVARELEIEKKLRNFGHNIAIQGELIGEGIQKNPYKLTGQTVHFFNVFDIDKYEPYKPSDFVETIIYIGLEVVPILANNSILPESMKELITSADGKSILHHDVAREGLVFRHIDKNISFKVISNKFLLNEK